MDKEIADMGKQIQDMLRYNTLFWPEQKRILHRKRKGFLLGNQGVKEEGMCTNPLVIVQQR